MDNSLYTAAMEGKMDVLMQKIDQLNVQVTHNDNTILHVAVYFGRLQCVKKILEECPVLLCRVNNKGETPLHIGAREEHLDIVKALIKYAKELDQEPESEGGAAKEILRATNEDKDTALHMALRNKHLDMVRLLTREDPDFPHPANNANETPLYLAAERGYDDDLVFAILENCTLPGYGGGPGGRTALHAAIIHHRDGSMRRLLDWKPDLIKEADDYGWTPLHYAARCGNVKRVKQLLEKDKSVAYITADKDEGKTALHIATAEGYVRVMEEILSHCPDCWEIVNDKGQNVFHVAVDMEKGDAIKFIKEKSWFSHLKKQKDIEGNTPMHLHVAASDKLNMFIPEWGTREFEWAFNNKNMTPQDILLSTDEYYYVRSYRPIGGGRNIVNQDQDYVLKWKRSRREEKKKKEAQAKETRKGRVEENNKRAGTHLIVATLIATVTFAAGFTMPGGYDSNKGPEQGTPVLLKQTVFKAFIITNTIAMICSISAGFLYASASFYKEVKKQEHRHLIAFWLILIAMGAMVLAFITGTYTVLSHSLGIAITACVVGSFSFLILIPEVKKLYEDDYIWDPDNAHIWEEIRINQI